MKLVGWCCGAHLIMAYFTRVYFLIGGRYEKGGVFYKGGIHTLQRREGKGVGEVDGVKEQR